MDNPGMLSFLLALLIALVLYAIFVKKNTDEWIFDNENRNLAMRVMNYIGSDIYRMLPQGVGKVKKKSSRLEDLIVKSGNPWKLSYQEFYFYQFVSAVIGLVVGFPLWFLLTNTVFSPPLWTVLLVTAGFGFFVPQLKYRDAAKKRDLEFKRQLPEALDLLIISLSAGTTFQQSLREILPNMADGVLKVEFENIVNQLDLGKTLKAALDDFASRAPNESIITFIRSVQEGIELNVPLTDTLTSRAEASRADFFALIHQKTATLESKMMAALAPTLVPALFIVLALPYMLALSKVLG